MMHPATELRLVDDRIGYGGLSAGWADSPARRADYRSQVIIAIAK